MMPCCPFYDSVLVLDFFQFFLNSFIQTLDVDPQSGLPMPLENNKHTQTKREKDEQILQEVFHDYSPIKRQAKVANPHP